MDKAPRDNKESSWLSSLYMCMHVPWVFTLSSLIVCDKANYNFYVTIKELQVWISWFFEGNERSSSYTCTSDLYQSYQKVSCIFNNGCQESLCQVLHSSKYFPNLTDDNIQYPLRFRTSDESDLWFNYRWLEFQHRTGLIMAHSCSAILNL